MTDEITIRPYAAGDRAAVAAITSLAWVGVTMAQLREEQFGVIGGRPWREHKAAEVAAMCDRAPERVVVAERANVVVGYASFELTHGGAVGVVGNNAVAPEWQGRGIGGQLIGRVLDELAGLGVQMLEVATFEHDRPARRVYERSGFELVAKTQHYFRAPGPVSGA